MEKPKYKKGDVCLFIVEGFEDEPDEWREIMIIKDEPYRYKGTGKIETWYYPIEGKANDCPEPLLKLKK